MAKTPKSPEEIFDPFVSEYKSAFGDDLIAVILYGSAARGEYVYKKSDINFLIILSEDGIRNIDQAIPLIKKWQKAKVSTPLILTHQYIKTSLDSFPIEFFTMKQYYQVIYGEDVLVDIQIDNRDLRLQCEREIRGKLLHLREGYLNTYGEAKAIQELLKMSLPTFVSIFSGLLHLKKQPIPPAKKDLLKMTADLFSLDFSVFDKIIKLNQNQIKFSKDELKQLVGQYIEQIRKLTYIVDEM
ncbi:MAG: nucleotidyltransferase domain-containing protein [bacterium]|nr:nucleotidyltransferase domain-containing protein [bacterium]